MNPRPTSRKATNETTPLALVGLGRDRVGSRALGSQDRVAVERQNRTVDIVLDGGQLRDLCATWGVPVPEALSRVRAAGVTGVAISEATVGDLIVCGRASLRGVQALDRITISLPVSRELTQIIANPPGQVPRRTHPSRGSDRGGRHLPASPLALVGQY